MANVIGNGKDRHLVDLDGDSITDETLNALKVKLVGSDTINANIGDIDLEFAGVAASVDTGSSDTGTLRIAIASNGNTVACQQNTYASLKGTMVINNSAGREAAILVADGDSAPNLDGEWMLGTHSLLSARTGASTTIGLTAEDSTHNALHVAISDGAGIAHVNASNELEVSISGITTNDIFYTRPVISTSVDNAYASVTDSSTLILAAETTRLSGVIVNDSDEVIYLAVEDAAIAGRGIRLNPNGGSYTEQHSNEAIYGICASGLSGNVTSCSINIS